MSGQAPRPCEAEILSSIDETQVVDLTAALVREASENPPGGEAACAEALARACRGHGLDVETRPVAPDRPNVVARLTGGDGQGMLFLGHLDTVPVGEGWTGPPFEIRRRGGRLVGRGVADTKGGLAAVVAALAALNRHGVELSGPAVLAAVVDEEDRSIGARQLSVELAGPHCPGAVLEQGCLAAVVTEPTGLETVVAARGDCYLDVEVEGRAAHSGNPSAGANAIYGAMSVVAAVQALHASAVYRPHPLLGPATWSVGQVRGGTGTSVVPASCQLAIDRRLLPGETAAKACAQLETAIARVGLPEGVTARVRVIMEMPGFETPADDPLVEVARAASVDAGAGDRPPAGWSAACDGGFLAQHHGIPTVVLGPGSITYDAHQADESVAVDDLVVAARIYALIALRLLGTEFSLNTT